MILTPAENYREAHLLTEQAARVDMFCPDQPDPEGCSRPDGLGGQCGHYLDALDEREHLTGLAAVHAALAQVPDAVAAAAMNGHPFTGPWTADGALDSRDQAGETTGLRTDQVVVDAADLRIAVEIAAHHRGLIATSTAEAIDRLAVLIGGRL